MSLSQLKNYFPVIFSGFGFAMHLVAFFPGFMSPDSIDQYGQALTGHISDWHPPVMVGLWQLLNHIYTGPQPMLIFQLLLFWTSCGLLLSAMPVKLWRTMICLVFFAPFVQNFVGYVIKDSQMALSWLLAVSIMGRVLLKERNIRPAEAFISLLLIIYGSWVRPNALPGALPLCWCWSWLCLRQYRPVYKAGVSLVIFLFLAAGPRLQSAIWQPAKTYPENKLYLQDLTGIFVKTYKNVFPQAVYTDPHFDTAYLRADYHPASFDHFWWNKEHSRPINDTSEYIRDQLRQTWLAAIKKYPATYLSNRWEGFLYYLRIRNRIPEYYVLYDYIDPNPYGISYHGNFIAVLLLRPVDWQAGFFYMRPVFWVLLNLALLFFMRGFRSRALAMLYAMLVLSSLLYMLPQFFIYQADTDFRYWYWNCIALSLSIALLLYQKYRHKKAG